MTNPKGFIPTGDGANGERYGRDPVTGRAFKSDGTVRKERVTKTPAQQMAEMHAKMRAMAGKMGKSIVAESGRFASFIAAHARVLAWQKEARSYGTPEAIAAKRARLEAQIADLDNRHALAVEYLANDDAATLEDAATVFDTVGEAFQKYAAENGGKAPDEDAANAILDRVIEPEMVAAVEDGADPDNDPFSEYRREKGGDEDEDEEGDTL